MVGNQEGIGMLKLECPQSHPVGRILKDAPHQAVQFDPGAQVGPRRFWPDEDEQPHRPQAGTKCCFELGIRSEAGLKNVASTLGQRLGD